MGRKSRWRSPETTAIRIPSRYADRLINQAMLWESQDSDFVQKTEAVRSVMVTLDDKSTIVSAPASVWAEADRLVDVVLRDTTLTHRQIEQCLPDLINRYLFA